MNEEQEHQRRIEARNAEMKETVERTKALGLPAAIKEMELKIKFGWGDFVFENAQRNFKRAGAMPDSDANKKSKIERTRQILAITERWNEYGPKALEFFKKVQQGEYPQNWTETPDWSLEGYPYEGIYSHNVIRWPATMERSLQQAGIDPSEATEDDKNRIAEEIVMKNLEGLLAWRKEKGLTD
jgi:hypothetical protein